MEIAFSLPWTDLAVCGEWSITSDPLRVAVCPSVVEPAGVTRDNQSGVRCPPYGRFGRRQWCHLSLAGLFPEHSLVNVQCTRCGEALLGAVNRCWRCGTVFPASVDSDDLPPVRRSPLVSTAVEVTGRQTPSGGASAEGEAAPRSYPMDGDHLPRPEFGTTSPVQVGSPFSDRSEPLAVNVPLDHPSNAHDRLTTRSPATQYPRNLAARGGATASLSLGLISWLGVLMILWGDWSPLGTVVTSLLGIGLGVWGVFSHFRRVAITGLLMGCITLAVSGFCEAIDIYVRVNGENPFAPVLDGNLDE